MRNISQICLDSKEKVSTFAPALREKLSLFTSLEFTVYS